ncbi:hypothetical protein CK203_101619 [Vitis vinifera]|uniref:Disease resistance protein n=1 Tax=Vitis vinifera TaxID=29760 RepID=A0A438DYV9_VITVI|nr:hypothetical protein CK203_101619 [Vitis vinifera]
MIRDCDKLQSLPKEGLPATLSSLTIKNCPLLQSRCKQDTGEDWSKIVDIPDAAFLEALMLHSLRRSEGRLGSQISRTTSEDFINRLAGNFSKNIHGSWELEVYKVVEDQCGGENTFELLMVSPKLYPSMMLPQGKEELN